MTSLKQNTGYVNILFLSMFRGHSKLTIDFNTVAHFENLWEWQPPTLSLVVLQNGLVRMYRLLVGL